MAIPPLNREAVSKALEELLPTLHEIHAGPHQSTKYDLLWKGYRFPPKVVISRAVQIQYGHTPDSTIFSGGDNYGHANDVLRRLGFDVVPKQRAALSLQLHARYSRKEVYRLNGIDYSPSRTRYLNVGLSPRCKDGGYYIFVTLDKEDLDSEYDYADELFSEKLIWVTRRNISADDDDYREMALNECRVSLFVRARSRDKFVYGGELRSEECMPLGGKLANSQLRFVWRLNITLPDELFQELILGVSPRSRANARRGQKRSGSRSPSSFDEFKKAYSYVLNSAPGRTVFLEHYNYQARLKRYLEVKKIVGDFERDFIDVSFEVDGVRFIGEIKVTRILTLPQAFRSALGQILDYHHVTCEGNPKMVIFLDQCLDPDRLRLAAGLGISVVCSSGSDFELLNPTVAPQLESIFPVRGGA